MSKLTSIGALFEALTANMSASEIKTAMITADISSRIEIERINRGMTQKDFANFMGVSQGMISKWESGDYNFTIKSISEIFEKLNLDFDFEITTDKYNKAIDTHYNSIDITLKLDSYNKKQSQISDELAVAG